LRARAGALKSSAKFLNIEGDTRQNVVLKKAFWDWTRYTETEERWPSSEFSATIDGLRHDAIDVAFELAGLMEMLPPERRAELARKVSIAGDPRWVTAQAARAFFYNELSASPTQAGALLLDQCRLGFVAARAVLCRYADEDQPDHWTYEEREWDVLPWFWTEFTLEGQSSQDWERGIFSGRGSAPKGRCSITLNGVYFAGSSLNSMLPASAIVDTTKPPKPNSSGGRPPAAFWDDLWCAVWGDIYRGDFTPKRQADVERAMLDWASANGHELSESAVKARARRLFAELQSEGRNPKG